MARKKKAKRVRVRVKLQLSLRAVSAQEARWLILRALTHDRFWRHTPAGVKILEVS
jgi:hypothetical protein